jgi:choline monooxygenase
MLDLNNVEAPIESANGLPNGCNAVADLYKHEQNTLFRDNWGTFDFDEGLPKPGCVKPIEFAGLQLLLLPDEYNEIKVFENVLHHRGIILVNKSQQLRGLVTRTCHAWVYASNGQLSKNPRIGGAICA